MRSLHFVTSSTSYHIIIIGRMHDCVHGVVLQELVLGWDDDVDVLSLSHSLDFLHSLSFYCIGGVVQVKRKAV